MKGKGGRFDRYPRRSLNECGNKFSRLDVRYGFSGLRKDGLHRHVIRTWELFKVTSQRFFIHDWYIIIFNDSAFYRVKYMSPFGFSTVVQNYSYGILSWRKIGSFLVMLIYHSPQNYRCLTYALLKFHAKWSFYSVATAKTLLKISKSL